MTTVYGAVDHGKYVLEMEGHATDNPIVCSAISSLVYALLGYLVNAEEAGTAYGIKDHVESGSVNLIYEIDDELIPIFHMFEIGIKQIEAKYPDLVQCDINF